MDSKGPDKYRALRRRLRAVVCCLWLMVAGTLLVSCSWVGDDTDDCPYGFWLRLHYTYNILDVEAVEQYVDNACVYVYDADGHYVKRIDVDHNELKANGYKVRVEGLPEGDYQFVVWSGLGSDSYVVSGDTQPMDAFRLSLATENGHSDSALTPLFHGYQPTVHYDNRYAVYDVGLMKDTNQLVCLVVSLSEQADMNADDYTMKVVAANGMMDALNGLPSAVLTTYEPFEQGPVTIDDPDYGELKGLRFSMMTLRLMSGQESRIVFGKRDTGETLFSISLPEYVGMIGSLYTNLGRPLSVQEYLDRQDLYTIVFYLSEGMDQLLQLKVNSWRLRANYHLKL